jgi:HEAT repeat protein
VKTGYSQKIKQFVAAAALISSFHGYVPYAERIARAQPAGGMEATAPKLRVSETDDPKELAKLGKPAVPGLAAALDDPNVRVRFNAAVALTYIKDARAAPALLKALKDNHTSVRGAAALGLGELKYAKATGALIAALENEEMQARFAIVKALGNMGPSAVPHLVRALGNSDIMVRSAVAAALGIIGKPAVPALMNAMENKSVTVRRMAAAELGRIRDERALTLLSRVMTDTNEDAEVRRVASIAINTIINGDAPGQP